MAVRVYRLLKVIAFDANGIWSQRYELSKQLQDLHIDVAVLSETHLKPHGRLYIVQNEEFSITCYKAKHILRDKPTFSSERMLLRTITASVQLNK
jgi:hypothetical protein